MPNPTPEQYALSAQILLQVMPRLQQPSVDAPATLLEQATRVVLQHWQHHFSQDARDFFAQQARQPKARPRLPALPADAPQAAWVSALLDHAKGIVLGEASKPLPSRAFLLAQLPTLRSAGVRTLYLGHFLLDTHQEYLDHFFAQGEITTELQTHMDALDSAAQWPDQQRIRLGQLLDGARRHGMRIKALDCVGRFYLWRAATASPPLLEDLEVGFWQADAVRYIAQLLINLHQSQTDSGKWIALMAVDQMEKSQAHPGLAELTGAIGIRVPRYDRIANHNYPYLAPDDGETSLVRQGGADGQTVLRYLQADYLLSLLANTRFYRNLRLRRIGDYLVCVRSGGETFEVQYRARSGHIRSALIEPRDGQYFLPTLDLPGLDQREQVYPQLSDVWRALNAGAGNRCIPQLRWFEVEKEHRQLASRFNMTREAMLMRLAIFSSPEDQAAFKVGKQDYRQELARLKLSETERLELKQCLTEPGLFGLSSPLAPHTIGALLQALHQQQRQRLAQQGQQWTEWAATSGGQRIMPLNHNLYLAATERSRGVCSALAAQLAAAWMLDQRQQANPAQAVDRARNMERFVQRFASASTQAETASARILGLGLLAWSYIDAEPKFGTAPPLSLPNLSAVFSLLAQAPTPTAYELSFANHALSLGISSQQGQRHFYLADPNFGFVEYHSASACQQGLALLHTQLMALSPARYRLDDAPVYGLRPYRPDLPEQALFPARLGKRQAPSTLRLADLSGPVELAQCFNHNRPLERDPWFQKLQKHLTLAEYRAKLLDAQPPTPDRPGTLLNAILIDVLLRQQSSFDYDTLAQSRLVELEVHRQYARLRIQSMHMTIPSELRIESQYAPEDVALLARYQDLQRKLSHSETAAGWLSRFRQHRQPRLHFDTLFLSTPLGCDGLLSAAVRAQLQRSCQATLGALPHATAS